MPESIIKVENLSKKYILRHQQERYTALRDVIANKTKQLFTKRSATAQQNQSKEEFWALKDVSFEIKQGDRVGIIGRNGAGKSTLLKLLSRITEPTTGRVTLNGRVASLLEVGTGFHPELTGRENIYLNGAILGMSKSEIKKKFDEIAEFAEVQKFLDTPVKRYSSGMYVRLAFSVAAHLEPEILIVDEVLAVGDAQFQKKCLGKMKNVGQEGRTVLFVSHNMGAISELCEKAFLLESGKLLNIGETSKIIKDYLMGNTAKLNGYIDLTHPLLRRNSLENSKFKWKSVQVLNSKKVCTTNIGMGEPFELIVEGMLDNDIDDLRVGFGVLSDMGFPLFNSHITDTDIKRMFKKGKLTFNIKFDLNIFSPGTYTFDLGANGEGVVDWIPEAFKINIEPSSIDGKSSVRSNYSGVVLYPCIWSV